MGSRVRPNRIMCVKCNICINHLRRYPALELEPAVTGIICSWVYPQIILEEDYVCEACRDLAITTANEDVMTLMRPLGRVSDVTRCRTDVCLLCGCSILQRQSDQILKDNPSEMQQSIINIIVSRLAPRVVSSLDRVCHACWLRTKREVNRMNRQVEIKPQSDIPVADVEQEQNVQRPESERPQTITLPNYRRAANSTHKCVFPNCNSHTLHGISDKLRATVLHNHKYYLPKLTRVCREHLSNNSWDTLYNSENSIETFSVEHIQHVFSFVNTFSPTLDFNNIEDMDERVFQYLLGLSKTEFNDLLRKVPRISEIRRGALGLAALLLKMRRGDSDEKISSLVAVPRRTLEAIMDSVRDVLC